jgi:hypothetical protein
MKIQIMGGKITEKIWGSNSHWAGEAILWSSPFFRRFYKLFKSKNQSDFEQHKKLISVGAFFFSVIRSTHKDEQKTKKKQNVMPDSHAKVLGLSFASNSYNVQKTFWIFFENFKNKNSFT